MAKTNIIAERFSSLLFAKGDVMTDLVILFVFQKHIQFRNGFNPWFCLNKQAYLSKLK